MRGSTPSPNDYVRRCACGELPKDVVWTTRGKGNDVDTFARVSCACDAEGPQATGYREAVKAWNQAAPVVPFEPWMVGA